VPLPIEVETERPDAIVVVTFHHGCSDDEFRAYLQRVADQLALQRPFSMVLMTK
jgi:hypothetical protein